MCRSLLLLGDRDFARCESAQTASGWLNILIARTWLVNSRRGHIPMRRFRLLLRGHQWISGRAEGGESHPTVHGPRDGARSMRMIAVLAEGMRDNGKHLARVAGGCMKQSKPDGYSGCPAAWRGWRLRPVVWRQTAGQAIKHAGTNEGRGHGHGTALPRGQQKRRTTRTKEGTGKGLRQDQVGYEEGV